MTQYEGVNKQPAEVPKNEEVPKNKNLFVVGLAGLMGISIVTLALIDKIRAFGGSVAEIFHEGQIVHG